MVNNMESFVGNLKNLRGKAYLLFPLALFLLYFAADKACATQRMKFLTQRDAVFLYFDYKPTLLDELEQVYRRAQADAQANPKAPRRKIFVVLGSSRMMFYSYEQFARNFPDWEMFNFSAPVTAPAYYAFIMERILERGIKPDYVLVETDPYQYNGGSEVFVRSNLAYSFDLRFILSNVHLFSSDEVSYFLARMLFAGYKYPPHLNHLRTRLKDPKNPRLIWLAELDRHQKENRGAGRSLVPRDNWYESDFARLEGIAKKDLHRMYSNYKISKRQFSFLRQLLDGARDAGSKVILIRPPLSRPAERLIREDKKLTARMVEWEQELRRQAEPYRFPYADLSQRSDFYCNTFFDASHMALDCYHPMLVLVMREYHKMSLPGMR